MSDPGASGTLCMLGVFNQIGSDKVSEDAGVEHIQKCFEEITAFYEDVAAGNA